MARVTLFPAGGDNDGVSQYRLRIPGGCLIDQGADVVIDNDGPKCFWSQRWEPTEQRPFAPDYVRLLGLLSTALETDVVVFQRPSQKMIAQVIPFYQRQGIRTVVDVDDRFDRIQMKNVAHDYYRKSGVNNYRWITEACKRADLVTTSTPALYDAYGFGHGVLLPNLVPEHYLKIASRREPTTMGWTGTLRTHPEDLQATGGAVSWALERHPDWRFSVIGDGQGVKEALKLPTAPSTTGGWIPFVQYAYKMARFALGIVPLQLNEFNESKSCLKAMEFASLGIPVVMSPIPDNKRLHAMGIGRLAKDPARWLKELDGLMSDEARRNEMSEQGRAIMESLTYEQHAERWLNAWLKGARS
jgi:glycosyltransferase involved in cell wall biosynthesis